MCKFEAIGQHFINTAKHIFFPSAAGLYSKPKQIEVLLDDIMVFGKDFEDWCES